MLAPAPAAPSQAAARDARRHVLGIPLFWRLLAVNLVVIMGGAVLSVWATNQLVLRSSFTPFTHVLLVLGTLALTSLATMLVLLATFQPVRSLRAVIQRFNAGDRSARATVSRFADPDIAALALELNGLWDRLEADAATIRDKTAHAERLAAQVISAQEDERRRVARELHDEAGQALTALIIGLERGLAGMPEHYASDLPVQPRQLVSNLRDLAVRTLDEVRKLALELRPSALDDLGLVAALGQYLGTYQERTGVVARLSVAGLDDAGERLPAAVETALFRIAQEALTNVARHAGARSVEVQLRRTAAEARLEVRDDGHGIPPLEGIATERHFGLFGMRERARLLGGSFLAQATSPRGTLVQVAIPLNGRGAA